MYFLLLSWEFLCGFWDWIPVLFVSIPSSHSKQHKLAIADDYVRTNSVN